MLRITHPIIELKADLLNLAEEIANVFAACKVLCFALLCFALLCNN